MHDFATNPKIGLYGYDKDSTTYYLRLFRDWDAVRCSNPTLFSGTHIRESYFSNICNEWLRGALDYVPAPVRDFLAEYHGTPAYKRVLEEYDEVRTIDASEASIKYKPIKTTTDALVVCQDHVLLVTRKNTPGKGLYALPGGYLVNGTQLIRNTLLELRQETAIDIPDEILQRCIIGSMLVNDDPHRDPRGHFITHASLIVIPDEYCHAGPGTGWTPPHVEGRDDAATARWVHSSKITRREMAFDHFGIIANLGKDVVKSLRV
jgi:bifunctional NMN adenylyltransferase/nudix hydrolase